MSLSPPSFIHFRLVVFSCNKYTIVMWLFLRFFGCNGFGTTSRENIGFWKRTRPEQTEENNLENQNHRNNEKNEHKNKKTWETPRLCWFVSCCVYSGDSSCRVVFWRICFLIVFLFHLFFSMCCWNQLSLLKLVSQYKGQMNHIGFRVYPTISNHTLPRNVSKRGVSKRIWLDFVCTQPYPTMCKV